jgi:hypothetical protein
MQDVSMTDTETKRALSSHLQLIITVSGVSMSTRMVNL